MFAYIKHSGKQFKVSEGSEITVDKLNQEVGSEIELDQIALAVKDNNEIIVAPKGKVIAEITEHFRGDKIVVLKFKKKKCYKRKKGHKQPFTKLKIKSLELEAA